MRYRGREVTKQDVDFIRGLIEARPSSSRRALSIALCDAWNWRQTNGTPKDAVCRGLLLGLHRSGHIVLPEPKWWSRNPSARLHPKAVEIPVNPIEGRLSDLGEIEIRQVRRTQDEALVNSLIQEHHYLGYKAPVGENLKYLVTAKERPIACFVWSSAARHLGPRDRYIGWRHPVRKANIRFIAYQSRFLILPWVRVPHLASHLLGRMSKRLSDDWQAVYAHPIYFTETFVDTERNKGTCYRAANWKELGITTGRGKADQTWKANRSLKLVLGYALIGDFRDRLCIEDAP